MGGEQTWICLVCGYVHRGAVPPDVCPVCGAPRDQFEAQQATPPQPALPAARQWDCLICGYRHEGLDPPETCPVCAAAADKFEPVTALYKSVTPHGGPLRVAVVGCGIAGLTAAEAVRQASPDAHVVIYSKESALPYYRLNLTRYVAGEITPDALPLHPESWYAQQRLELRRGAAVDRIDATDLAVTAGGQKDLFDRIIVTAGAHPFVPPIPGAQPGEVDVLRSVDDADALIAAAERGGRCIIIGGGILGLETAGALARRGMETLVLESYDWLLPRQLNAAAGTALLEHVTARGINVIARAKTQGIESAGGMRRVTLDDGRQLEAGLVVVTTGVRANSHLARRAELAVNQGIRVDAHLASSHPGIYAAGDVAEAQGVLYGLWEPARYQGYIAGMNAAGISMEFGGMPRANTLKVLGIDLFSVGIVEPADGSYLAVDEQRDGAYDRFLFRDNRLVGAVLIGDAGIAAAATKAIKTAVDFSAVLQTPEATAIRQALRGKA